MLARNLGSLHQVSGSRLPTPVSPALGAEEPRCHVWGRAEWAGARGGFRARSRPSAHWLQGGRGKAVRSPIPGCGLSGCWPLVPVGEGPCGRLACPGQGARTPLLISPCAGRSGARVPHRASGHRAKGGGGAGHLGLWRPGTTGGLLSMPVFGGHPHSLSLIHISEPTRH